jgi:hypothetical protein
MLRGWIFAREDHCGQPERKIIGPTVKSNNPLQMFSDSAALRTEAAQAAASSDWTRGNGARRRSLQKKVAACFGASLAALWIVGLVSYLIIMRFIDASRWESHTYQAMASIDAVDARLSETAMADRGCVITGDERFVKSFRESEEQIMPSVESLRFVTRDNPSQQRRIERLEPLIAEKIRFFDSLLETRRARGGGDRGAE